MNRVLSLLLLLLLSCTLSAQQKKPTYKKRSVTTLLKGKVTGAFADEESGERLPFVSIILKNIQSDKTINGAISDDKGMFRLIDVPVGEYELLASFVGYESISKKVSLTARKPDSALGTLLLTPNVTSLDEVVVTAEKAMVENKIDKVVYNAELDVANAGGDATDVLRRAPMLNVDLEGNVSLRGNSNIQILINGKPSSVFSGNIADALRVIPADEVKSIEVITSPSAKYDGEGTAGIINIITKKKNIEGISGNVNASVGTRSNNAVLGLNMGKGRFGFNVNGSSYFGWPRVSESEFYREDFVGDEKRILEEEGSQDRRRLGFSGTAGAFYDFNAFHGLTSSFRLRGFTSSRDGVFNTDFSRANDDFLQRYQRRSDDENLVNGYEWSLDYGVKFPEQEGRELILAYKIDGNVRDRSFAIVQNDLIGDDTSLFRDERNSNDSDNSESTLQLDYVHPIGKKLKLETGVKNVWRAVNSEYQYDVFDPSLDLYVVDRIRTDDFDYRQGITSGYVSGNMGFGKDWGLIAGLRYEHTAINGGLSSTENDRFTMSYDNWLPSVTLSRKVGKSTTLKATYNRRIQRPGLRFINPYVVSDNNRNIQFGNPNLDPEINNQYELGVNTFVKKISFNAAIYYRKTSDIIESFLTVDDEGVSVTTYRNIGVNNAFGTNIFTSATLFGLWTLRGGINVYSYDVSGRVDGLLVSNTALLSSGNLNSSIKLKNDWIIDLFGFYRARRQTLQGFNPSFSIFSMGIKKNIWEKKGSIGLRMVEPFFENKVFGSELRGIGYFQSSETRIPFRSFGINFSYRFGKTEFKRRRSRSRIKNDDVKGGGDGQRQF